MSGTSLDGVDAVAADFSSAIPTVRGRAHADFPPELKADLLALCQRGDNEIERAGDAALRLSEAYAGAVAALLEKTRIPKSEVLALGAHGQTIRHCPERHFSWQLLAPARLAELTGIDVIADFRSADLAAGGQGAPLVPAFHQKIFQSAAPRCIVNIGGISNITVLPAAGTASPVLGFDCGPGNMLMDAWCAAHIGQPFDRDGMWAQSGVCQTGLLKALLSDPYFRLPPPKSTGRELFSLSWLKARLAQEPHALRKRDVQATLLALTAQCIADAVAAHAPLAEEVYLCGGGALNPALVQAISGRLPTRQVRTTAALGIPPMDVEGLAFAWLAFAWTQAIPGNCPSVTGAVGPRRLGALYPASSSH